MIELNTKFDVSCVKLFYFTAYLLHYFTIDALHVTEDGEAVKKLKHFPFDNFVA